MMRVIVVDHVPRGSPTTVLPKASKRTKRLARGLAASLPWRTASARRRSRGCKRSRPTSVSQAARAPVDAWLARCLCLSSPGGRLRGLAAHLRRRPSSTHPRCARHAPRCRQHLHPRARGPRQDDVSSSSSSSSSRAGVVARARAPRAAPAAAPRRPRRCARLTATHPAARPTRRARAPQAHRLLDQQQWHHLAEAGGKSALHGLDVRAPCATRACVCRRAGARRHPNACLPACLPTHPPAARRSSCAASR